jgi:hypothetical protein
MSTPSGIIGSGQTDGRTHPLGGVLVHVLSIVRVPQDLIFFKNTWAAMNVPRGDHGTTNTQHGSKEHERGKPAPV